MFKGWAQKIDDRLNPIVVKELRQAVQSKFIIALLWSCLFIQLAVIVIALLATSGSSESFRAGATVFGVLYGVLMFMCILFLPAYAGLRLAYERSPGNMDLMFATAISPWAIIRGKLLSTLIIAAIIYSACAPFMTFTYLLRGIDLPSIFFALVAGFFIIASCVQMTIFLACIPASRFLKVLLALLGLGILIATFSGIVGMLGSLLLMGRFLGNPLDSWQFWAIFGTCLAFGLMGIGLCFCFSVALVSPLSANRTLPIRIYMMGMWLVSGIIAVVWSGVTGASEPVFMWGFGMALLLSLGMLIASSERDTWGPRVRRKIPRRALLRLPAFLLFVGNAGGIAWALLMMMLTFCAVCVVAGTTDAFADEFFQIAIGICLYIYGYSMTAVLLRSVCFKKMKPGHTWVLIMALHAIGLMLPLFFALVASPHDWFGLYEKAYLHVTNPFLLGVSHYREACLTFAACWAGAVGLLGLPWFIKRVSAFQPYASATGTQRGPAGETSKEADADG
ncbi:MAG: hypothetical protein QGD94_08985 [Planctomycetia bacterium]|nr:hypothetical protein [Planctomycetia bacterium]